MILKILDPAFGGTDELMADGVVRCGCNCEGHSTDYRDGYNRGTQDSPAAQEQL